MLQPDEQLIGSLRDLLDWLHYDSVQRSLRSNYFTWPFPQLDEFRRLIQPLPERQRLAYELLMLGDHVKPQRITQLWGRERFEDLKRLGLLKLRSDGRIDSSGYAIVSYLGRYLIVTLNPYYPSSRDPDSTIYIGPDSLTLAAQVVGSAAAPNVLDLCSGSGIQGILAAPTARTVVAVERNAHAAQVARCNALLNRVADRVTTYTGDLYTAPPPGRYDLIIANPPFLPVPDGVAFPACGHGGSDGLSVMRPLLEGLPAHLQDGGRALIYAEGPGSAHQPFVAELLEGLARSYQFDSTLTIVYRVSIEHSMILRAIYLQRLRPHAMDELRLWRELYQRLEATHMHYYLLTITHGDGQRTTSMAFDPVRAERGIEVQPGVILTPRRS